MPAAAALAALGLVWALQAASPVAGDWHGDLKIGAVALPLVVHVAPSGEAATLDSPQQNSLGNPAAVTVQGRSVSITAGALHATIQGELSADGAAITGAFTQGAVREPFVLVRGGLKPLVRPQEPRPPFPYRAEEVAFENPGKAHLAGTLTLPAGGGPYPAVVLITGSGQQDRDEAIMGHKPFLLWADTLTRRGIAVLRLDDRGVGGSTGDVAHATTADFATDIEAALAYLRTRKDIDPNRTGLMGHSEGAEIAPMVAARDPRVAFVVMLAGLGEDGETVMLHQKRLIEEAEGVPPAVEDRAQAVVKPLEDAEKGVTDDAEAQVRLAAAWKALMRRQGAPETTPIPADVARIAAPWTRFFLAYDPRADLAKLRCPVLAVGGSKDLQVPAAENLAGIRAADPKAETVELPGLNHLLQTARTGAVSEYAALEETVSPVALAVVTDWIVAHTQRRVGGAPEPR